AGMVVALLEAGADANAARPEGETVLMTAARIGRVETVKALLARGAAVNAVEQWFGETALMLATAENHVAVVRTLIEGGADVNARTIVLDGEPARDRNALALQPLNT